MGVRGLHTYMMKYVKGGYETVNIPEIAEKYRQETGLDPVIALDISSCVLEIFYMNEIDTWVESDRYKKFELAVNKFLDSFTKLGIKFYVIFDGVTPAPKIRVAEERTVASIETHEEIYQVLKDSTHEKTSNLEKEDFFITPTGAHSVLHSIFQSNKYCTCKYSVVEADEELADFAAKNQCFAYLTKDTDFIIYGGPKYCLNIETLNLEDMTAKNYNREALIKRLRIEPGHLPLFALICGNDYIPYDEVKYFHKELCPRYEVGRVSYHCLFPAIANFINKLRLPFRRVEIFEYLPEISKRIFKSDEYTSLLEAGLKNYWGDIKYPDIPKTGDENWDRILEKCHENYVKFFFESRIYNILIDCWFTFGPYLENTGDTSLPPSALACLPLRQKFYGILLFEKPNKKNITIAESLTIFEDTLDVPLGIKPKFIRHPGLLTLWDTNLQTRKIQKARWRTFCKAISLKLKYQDVKALPRDLAIPLLALFYMKNELKAGVESVEKRLGNLGDKFKINSTTEVENFEIEALLAQAVIANKCTIEEIDEIIEKLERENVCWSLNLRAVHLKSVFENICKTLFLISMACGNLISRSEASASRYFDGKLFMYLYNTQLATDCKIWKYCSFEPEIINQYEQFLNLINMV